jgi:hypothetical protein
MESAEALSRRRRRLLLIAAIGFLVWQGSLAMRGVLEAKMLLAVGLVGAGTFLVTLVQSVRMGRSVEGRKARKVLNDELAQRNRLVALATGFWAMLVVSAAIFAAAELLRLNAGAAAHVILTTGIVTALVRFALLEGLLERDD